MPYKDPAARKANARRYYREGRLRPRNPPYWNGRKYNLTEEAFNEMVEEQGGRCAICGTVPEKKRLCVDHDHRCCPGKFSCGQCIRGLICQPCNSGIGFLKDDLAIVKSAARYMRSFDGANS